MSDGAGLNRELEGWIPSYRAELHAHLVRMLGSPDDADDVLQVVWIKALECPPTVGSERNARAWLYRVATNAALDRIGSEKRRRRLLADRGAVNDHAESGESTELDEASRQRIRECCASLPRKQRDAVWHRWIDQEDYDTVARKLGTSVPTVRANVHHGLKRLRQELKDLWSQETDS